MPKAAPLSNDFVKSLLFSGFLFPYKAGTRLAINAAPAESLYERSSFKSPIDESSGRTRSGEITGED
jgi:hypothetical protein